MKLDVTSYYNSLPTVEAILNAKNNANTPLREMTALIAVATGIPVLAVCYMVEKLRGESKELDDQKARLKEFYGYTEVVL